MPTPNIQQEIAQVIKELGLTAYGISQVIAAETDSSNTERMACEKRWQRWQKGERLDGLQRLAEDLHRLGYELKIERKG